LSKKILQWKLFNREKAATEICTRYTECDSIIVSQRYKYNYGLVIQKRPGYASIKTGNILSRNIRGVFQIHLLCFHSIFLNMFYNFFQIFFTIFLTFFKIIVSLIFGKTRILLLFIRYRAVIITYLLKWIKSVERLALIYKKNIFFCVFSGYSFEWLRSLFDAMKKLNSHRTTKKHNSAQNIFKLSGSLNNTYQ